LQLTILLTTMSLAEQLQSSTENISVFKTILWCFYPMAVLVALELLSRTLNDDDQDGGKIVPILQGAQ